MEKSGTKAKKKPKRKVMKLGKNPAILEELKKSEEAAQKPVEPPKEPEPLHLQVMRAKLSQLITDDERDELAEVLMLPGFKVMMKISRLLQSDWGDQLINANYRYTNRDLISNYVIEAQGMKHGLVAFFRMLAMYRRAIEQAENEKKKK